MSPKDWLAQRKKICAEAIPGPYRKTWEAGDHKEFLIEGQEDEWERLECTISTDDCDQQAAKRTGDFIIDARTSLPQALSIIEQILAAADMQWDEPERAHVYQIVQDVLDGVMESK
jgi:hypothetical protein